MKLDVVICMIYRLLQWTLTAPPRSALMRVHSHAFSACVDIAKSLAVLCRMSRQLSHLDPVSQVGHQGKPNRGKPLKG